jgi:hypothetical protein
LVGVPFQARSILFANDLFATSTTSLFIVIAAYSGERTARSMKSAACVVILSLIISEFQCFVKGGNTGSMISVLRFHLCTPFVFI